MNPKSALFAHCRSPSRCGGYLGGHPGPHMEDCFVYDHEKNKWSDFEPLPEGRAGGGMVFSSDENALVFSAGAERPEAGNPEAIDYQHTWMYSFDDPGRGWVEKDDIPFLTNHMSFGRFVATESNTIAHKVYSQPRYLIRAARSTTCSLQGKSVKTNIQAT